MSAVVELKSELLPRLIGLTREENRITLHAALYLICTFVRYDASLESRKLKPYFSIVNCSPPHIFVWPV